MSRFDFLRNKLAGVRLLKGSIPSTAGGVRAPAPAPPVAPPATPAAAPAATPAAQPPVRTQAMNDRRLLNQAVKGQTPTHLVPEHLRGDLVDLQRNREYAAARLDRYKGMREDIHAPSTPERQDAALALRKMDVRSPEYKQKSMELARMPHSAPHQELLAKKMEGAQGAYTQRKADAEQVHLEAQKAVAAKPLPPNYDRAAADRRTNFETNNQWHRYAPVATAAAGALTGALTADESQGESALTRGLVGGAMGAGAGFGVRHGAPYAAGALEKWRTPAG